MTCTVEQAMATYLNNMKQVGKEISAEVTHGLGFDGKTKFAEVEAKTSEAAMEDILSKQPPGSASLKLAEGFKKMGLPPNLAYSNYRPSTILGDFNTPLEEALQAHRVNYPNLDNFQAYQAEVLPVVQGMMEKAEDFDPALRRFAMDHLESYRLGGEMYASGSKNPVTGLARNVVSKWAMLNPFITIGNAFEILPKSLGVYGVRNTSRGVRKLLDATGGKPWEKIPELVELGAYGRFGEEGSLLNKLGDSSEDFLRNVAYFVGEEAGDGGFNGLSKVAYVYKPGDVPLMMRSLDSRQSVALLRFSLEASKQYAGWVGNIVKGIKDGDMATATQATKALALFEVVTYIQSGNAAIPEPIWAFLDEDENRFGVLPSRQQLEDVEDSIPFVNPVKKLTGFDISDKVRAFPVSVQFGIGLSMLNRAIRGISETPGKVSDNLEQGNVWGGAARVLEGLVDASLLTQRFPLLNMSTNKVITEFRKLAEGDQDLSETALKSFEKTTGLKQAR